MPKPQWITVREQDGVFVVGFRDERILSDLTIAAIGRELCSVADREDCRKMLVSFARVSRLSSMVLGTLLMVDKRLRRKEGRLKVCRIAPDIREVFTVTKLDQLLDIQDSEQQALAEFSSG